MFNHTLAFKPDAYTGRDQLGATNKGLYIIFPGVTSSIQRANRKGSWYTREKETVAEKENYCTSNKPTVPCTMPRQSENKKQNSEQWDAPRAPFVDLSAAVF